MTLKSRLSKSLDALLTAPLRPKRSLFQQVRSIIRPRMSHYDRLGLLAKLISTLIPPTEKCLHSLLYSPCSLPFSRDGLELIAYGSGSTVFRLPARSGARVLKVYRRSLGLDRQRLAELARTYKQKHDLISTWYAGPTSITVPAAYLILKSPLLGLPAVGCIQPFIAEEKRDFFTDFSDGELLDLMRREGAIKEQIVRFGRETLRIAATKRLCVDFVGQGNLIVVLSTPSPWLCLIDTGIFDLNYLELELPETYSQMMLRLERLERLLYSAPAGAS